MTEAFIPGVIIVYGEGDWPSVLARTGPHATRNGPERMTTHRVITVGDLSVKIITMPGTPPARSRSCSSSRTTASRSRWPTPAAPRSHSRTGSRFFDEYIASARKFAQAAAAYGATALISNHTEFDNAYFKAFTAQSLRPAAVPFDEPGPGRVPNPFFVGQRRVLNYMGVVELCAMAAKLRATGSL